MPAPTLSLSRRLRETPYSERVARAGPRAVTVYNHMLLPTVFRSMAEDCRHLRAAVQLWDVACQRQIEIAGPDAARLADMLTPRGLAGLPVGRCRYAPMVDHCGGILNDAVVLRRDEDRFWISTADSDLIFWVEGIARGEGFDAAVREPDISPLAVQGPRAEAVVARVFGESVREIRFFHYRIFEFQGRAMPVSRSGYSTQDGFEVFCTESRLGPALWDALAEAGCDLDLRAGGPNLIDRIEGGLLSYGNDMTRANTPDECGLGALCDPPGEGCIGHDALLRQARQGPARQIRSLAIEGEPVPDCTRAWPLRAGEAPAGQVTSAVWAPDRGVNVALGMVERAYWDAGATLTLDAPDGPRRAHVRAKAFA